MASAATDSTLGDKEAMARTPDALQSLRDEVQEVTRPYTTADEEPPFSGGELIVMALVHTDDDTFPKDRILRWIINTFKYYHDAFIDNASQNLEPNLSFRGDSNAVVLKKITRAFMEYEVPIREGQVSFWSVSTQAARFYLRHWLEPEREGVFPFLDLPPEIRNYIYELIFTFPSSSVYMNALGNFYMERIDEPGPCGRKWSDSGVISSLAFINKSANDTLTLLSANRQIYEEAMPFFYQLNNFYFDSYSVELLKFAVSMPRSRFEHLRKLHIDFTEAIQDWLLASWADITKALSTKSVGFGELSIATTDDAWLGRGHEARKFKKCGIRTSTFKCIEDIPGFTNLAMAVARTKVVRWEGDCPLIREFVGKEVAGIQGGGYTIEEEEEGD
ncbi:hypothetical protein KC345_g4297 [Hortaea werneckii]|nr:hypothetical protein KC345_g4297 [Hortaea werneckii]